MTARGTRLPSAGVLDALVRGVPVVRIEEANPSAAAGNAVRASLRKR